MNKLFTCLILGTAALTFSACSSDSGKNPNATGINPQTKQEATKAPANPAATGAIDQLLMAMETSQNMIPDFNAIFNRDFEDLGGTPEEDLKGQEYAISRLSPEAKSVLQDIQSKCQLVHLNESQSGDLERTGSSKIVQRTRSAEGSNCPISIQQTNKITLHADLVSSTASNLSGQMSLVRDLQVKDAALAEKSGLLQTKMTQEMTGESQDNEATKSFSNRSQSSGKLLIRLASGMTWEGTYTENRILKNTGAENTEKIESLKVAELNSSAGTVRVSLITEDSKTKAYLNGQEVDPKMVENLLGEN